MNKPVNLKEEKERLLEERAKNPEPVTLKTTETEQLRIENMSLKKAMLNQQMQDLDKETELLLNSIKVRGQVPNDWTCSINLGDLTKAILSPPKSKE
jgi:hypothetical protein